MSEAKTKFRRVMVVDDDEAVREDLSFSVTVADREPIVETGPLGDLKTYLQRPRHADAAISDHQLRPAGYAAFDGATLVAEWYKRRFPAILCTTYERANADHLRSLRRWLPVVMKPQQLDPDSLITGLEVVQREIDNNFTRYRRPWRALIHFVDFHAETNTVDVKLPGWGTDAVALRLVDLPLGLAERGPQLVDLRVYAQANLGTESNDELYVYDWELP